MAVYIVVFLISVFLLYYADSKRFRGLGVKICVGIALLLPCLIAGLRADSVGTDVAVYLKPLFQKAQLADSFQQFCSARIYKIDSMTYASVGEYEIGFLVLCYLHAKVFNSMPLLLFTIQALTVIPIYKGLRAFSKNQPVWLGMCVYYLMFYNMTLNMMRQWIAMAFLLYAFQFMESRQYRRYFLTVGVAVLFHYSAVLGIAIFFVYQLVAKENPYNKRLKVILLILIGIGSILGLDLLVNLISLLGMRYRSYFSGSLMLMPNQLLYRLPVLLLLIWRWKYLKEASPYADFFLVLIFYDLLASQLTSIFSQSARIGLFFSEYYMLVYPTICMASGSKKNRQAMKVITLCYLVIYWLYTYVYMNASETIPYQTCFGL